MRRGFVLAVEEISCDKSPFLPALLDLDRNIMDLVPDSANFVSGVHATARPEARSWSSGNTRARVCHGLSCTTVLFRREGLVKTT